MYFIKKAEKNIVVHNAHKYISYLFCCVLSFDLRDSYSSYYNSIEVPCPNGILANFFTLIYNELNSRLNWFAMIGIEDNLSHHKTRTKENTKKTKDRTNKRKLKVQLMEFS